LLPLKDNVPTTRFPIVTILLIVVNLAVFGWELTLSDNSNSNLLLHQAGINERDQAEIEGGAIPYRITHPGKDCAVGAQRAGFGRYEPEIVCEGTDEYNRATSLHEHGAPFVALDSPPWWETVFTAMFMHASWLHILGNMLFLWIFGNNIEDSMGRGRYLLFYLLAGIAACYAQAAIDPGETGPTLGASGAIAGVLGGYILLHPRARVLTLVFLFLFVTLIEIPAVVMLGVWFILQAVPAVSQFSSPDVTGGGGVAYLAHIGGFVFGLLAIKLFANRARVSQPPGMA
jgi:membrane associated rhomboid family serine protease